MRCGANSAPGQKEPNGESFGYQAVTIPANATSAVLTFWYYAYTTDATHDFQEASILDTNKNVLQNIFHLTSNAQAWTQKTVDLSAFKGKTILVYFNVHSNGSTTPTTLWVDDVSVQVK